MKVIYIVPIFPKISFAFILHELIALKRKGVIVEVFALQSAQETKVHAKISEIGIITFLSKQSRPRIIFSHLYWFSVHPLRYLRVLFFSLNPQHQCAQLFLFCLYFLIQMKQCLPDVVHAHFGKKASNIAMLFYLLTGIPFTFTTHRTDIFESPPTNYRIKSQLAKKHITISQYNRLYIAENFDINKDDIAVIHSGVDCPLQKGVPSAVSRSAIILSIGRLEEEKGMDTLIYACHKLQHIPYQCIIAGEGSQRGELHALISDLGLIQRVWLLGNQTQEEIQGLLKKVKVVVLASRKEGIPVALMEAMASGVPVIGSSVGGVCELIEDGVCGFLVPPDNSDILADKIDILLKDSYLWGRFSESGYNKVYKRFNVDSQSEELIKIWEGKK